MPNLHYYRYVAPNEKIPYNEQIFLQGWNLIENHPLSGKLLGHIYLKQKYTYDADSAAIVDNKGNIYINIYCKKKTSEWFYIIAHCLLHLAFGHFDKDTIPCLCWKYN